MNNLDRFFTPDARAFATSYFDYLASVLVGIDGGEIAAFAETLLDARHRGATVFFIGNGGSAATASHFANDLAVGTRELDPPFRVMSLTDNAALMTAVGNDYGFDDVFVRQLQVYARSGDVLVAISASGNSPNLVKAFECARAAGVRTVAITAFDGGQMKRMADEGIHVPTVCGEYGPAEDAHLILNHVVAAFLARVTKLCPT